MIPPRQVVAGRRRPRLVLPTKDQPVAEGSLTKAALVEEVADATGLTKKRAEVIVDTVFGNIAEALQQGEKVELRGFGSFRLRCREPRRGRNPQDRRTSERAAKARRLLQARQGAEGTYQPGPGIGRAAMATGAFLTEPTRGRLSRLVARLRIDHLDPGRELTRQGPSRQAKAVSFSAVWFGLRRQSDEGVRSARRERRVRIRGRRNSI